MKQFQQKKSQSGRSMVEMLGVLAIIGILSVGGISGYRYAMTQMAVNESINLFNYFYLAVKNEENSDYSIFQEALDQGANPMTNSGAEVIVNLEKYLCNNYFGKNTVKQSVVGLGMILDDMLFGCP